MNHAEIVNTDVCELRAARNLADRPNAGRGRLEPLVDFDVSSISQFNPGQLQPKSLGIGSAARRHQHMTALKGLLGSILAR